MTTWLLLLFWMVVATTTHASPVAAAATAAASVEMDGTTVPVVDDHNMMMNHNVHSNTATTHSPNNKKECSIYMAPSSLKGVVNGYGVYTTRDIAQGEAFLQAPDFPSIPVLDYGMSQLPRTNRRPGRRDEHDNDDNDDFVDPDQARARRQFLTMFNNYWWGRGKPDHVAYLADDESTTTVDFQITFGSLPNHHCVLDALDSPYPSSSSLLPSYDDSWRLSLPAGCRGAFSYHLGRNFTASRSLMAGEEIFLNYGYCQDHDWDQDDDDADNNNKNWQRFIPNEDDYEQVAQLVQNYLWPAIVANQTPDWDQFQTIYGQLHYNPLVQQLLPTTVDQVQLLMNGWPNDQNLVQRVAYYQGTTPRTPDWIRQHGWCLEHLVPQRSTIPHAGYGALAQHDIAEGDMVVPAPILHIINRSALDMYDRHGNRMENQQQQQQQLLLNYCIGHVESTVLLCPNTNANLLNHDSVQPNAQFRWMAEDEQSEEWRRLSVDELWQHSQGGQRGLMLQVVALRDIAVGEEVTVDYGRDWETAWQQHYVRIKEKPSPLEDLASSRTVQKANEQDVIRWLQSHDLRKTTMDLDEYMFTGCQYRPTEAVDYSHQNLLYRMAAYNHPMTATSWNDDNDSDDDNDDNDDPLRDWESWDNATILNLLATEYRHHTTHPVPEQVQYSTHDDESHWPCSVIYQEEEEETETERSTMKNTTTSYYTVRIHQHPRHDETTIWTERHLPHFVTHVPRGAIHYFVKPYQSDQQRPDAFRHFLGLAEIDERTAFPKQWKNRSRQPSVVVATTTTDEL